MAHQDLSLIASYSGNEPELTGMVNVGSAVRMSTDTVFN